MRLGLAKRKKIQDNAVAIAINNGTLGPGFRDADAAKTNVYVWPR